MKKIEPPKPEQKETPYAPENNGRGVEYVDKLSALHQHASQLALANTIDEIAEHSLDAMKFTLGFDWAGFFRVENGYLKFIAIRGAPVAFSGLPLDGSGITVKAANTRSIIRVPDVRKDSAYVDGKGLDWKGPPTMLSELAVPVVIDDEVAAVLNAESSKLDAFTGEDQTLLEILAFHVGSALKRLADVAERRRVEETLKESEERYRLLIERQGGGLGIVDLEERFTYCNLVAEEIFKVPQGTLVGRNLQEFTSPEAFQLVKEQTGKRLAGEKSTYELEITCPDGEKRQLLVTAAPWLNKDGVLVGTTAMFRDITERKRMEDDLRRFAEHLEELVEERTRRLAESENRLRLITDSLPALISYLDAELRYGFTNKAYEEWFGKPTSEIIGRHIRDVLGEQTYQRTISHLNGALSGKIQSYDYELPHRSRGTRYVTATYVPEFGADGQVRGIFVLGTDVTDRKRAEIALRESEQKYRELFEASPVSLWEEDFSEVRRYFDDLRSRGINDLRRYFMEHPEELVRCAGMAKILDVNEATLGLYGAKTVEELRGELGRIFTRDFQEKFTEELVALSEGRTLFASEFDNQTLTGDVKHVDLILSVVPGYEDTLGKVLVSIIDLTERKRMEEELRSTKERLEYVVTSNPAVIYSGKPLADLSDWELTYLSENVANLLGYETREFVDHPEFWKHHVHPEDLHPTMAHVPRLWKKGQHTFQYRFLHRDGTYRWIREEATMVRDADGKPIEVNGYWIDVTERKRLEEALAKSQRLATIGEVAAMVGHDLRNPLQGIAGAAYYLRTDEKSKLSNQGKAMIQTIQESIGHSDKIINDLLEYSRELHLELSKTNVKSITRDALAKVKIPIGVHVVNATKNQPPMKLDAHKMTRVFMNLIRNAFDAMPKGGTLTITSTRSRDRLHIAFKDTGEGMTTETLTKLWSPLFTTKSKGMGLGLAIIKRFVEAHEGSIDVESKPGKGSTFTVRLPIKRSPKVKR